MIPSLIKQLQLDRKDMKKLLLCVSVSLWLILVEISTAATDFELPRRSEPR